MGTTVKKPGKAAVMAMRNRWWAAPVYEAGDGWRQIGVSDWHPTKADALKSALKYGVPVYVYTSLGAFEGVRNNWDADKASGSCGNGLKSS